MRSQAVPLPSQTRSFPWWAGLVVGIVAVVIGVLLILSPRTAATYLFWILGIACLVGGVVALASILFRRVSWGWKLLAGIVAIVLGLALISQPLFSAYLVAAMSLWILGAIVIVGGVVLIIMGFSQFFSWAYAVLAAGAVGLRCCRDPGWRRRHRCCAAVEKAPADHDSDLTVPLPVRQGGAGIDLAGDPRLKLLAMPALQLGEAALRPY
jgi:uncharacterized membrane protein HdeD (DUF308 family)